MRRRVGSDAEAGGDRRTFDASAAHDRGDPRAGEEESDSMAFGRPAHGAFRFASGVTGRVRGRKGTPMRAFFDIDTQIDFLFPAGALYSPGAERIIEPVARLNRFA